MLQNLEQQRPRGVGDLHYPHAHRKERERRNRVVVQPAHGRPVRLLEARRDPDDGLRLYAGKVGEDLAQMVMVRVRQLVLDQHAAAVRGIYGDDVRRKLLDLYFGALKLQRNPDRLREPLQVLRQPRREVSRLMFPHRTRRHVFQFG